MVHTILYGTKLKQIVKILMKYLFSHIGLFALVTGYCVGGAYLFAFIESPDVIRRIQETANVSLRMEADRQRLADTLTRIKCSDSFDETVKNLLDDYQRRIADAIQNYSYTGVPKTEADIVNGWVFPSALLFTTSIVTTIGYGHVTPKTALGHIVVIPYALLGIPLMLMFLANIGEFMARCFRVGFTRGCCFICWRSRNKNYKWENNHVRMCANIQEENRIKDEIPNVCGEGAVEEEAPRQANHQTVSPNTEQLDASSPSGPLDEQFLSVPISLTVLITALYLCVGAILFSTWNNWSMVQAAYFSFVSLATIGFGDMIPGLHEAGTTIGQIKLVISSLYIVFGLAVLSMAFNLMIEEMFSKFKWLGQKLGIIKPTEHHKDTPGQNHQTLTTGHKEEMHQDERNDHQETNHTLSCYKIYDLEDV